MRIYIYINPPHCFPFGLRLTSYRWAEQVYIFVYTYICMYISTFIIIHMWYACTCIGCTCIGCMLFGCPHPHLSTTQPFGTMHNDQNTCSTRHVPHDVFCKSARSNSCVHLQIKSTLAHIGVKRVEPMFSRVPCKHELYAYAQLCNLLFRIPHKQVLPSLSLYLDIYNNMHVYTLYTHMCIYMCVIIYKYMCIYVYKMKK